MAKEIQDTVRDAVSRALDGAGASFTGASNGRHSGGALSGAKGVAAGAGAAALIPLAVRHAGKLPGALGQVAHPGDALKRAGASVGESVEDRVGQALTDKLGASGPGGLVANALKGALPFGGGDDDRDDDGGDRPAGVGKGRRMPVQQSVDIGAPIDVVYDHWTRFEDWPQFMHRVTRVTQEDDCTVSFATKIWGKTKEFTAEIETQRPAEKIKWRVTQGMTHTGVVTFHELGPNLTRVLLGMDVEPGGLMEKAARGMRHVKRAARGDLHRFKAFVEMSDDDEVKGWRGVIEDGKLKSSRSRQGASSSGGRSSRSRNGHSGGSSRSRASDSAGQSRRQNRSHNRRGG